MSNDGQIIIQVLLDDSEAQQDLNNIEGKFSKLGGALKTVGATALGIVGVVGGVATAIGGLAAPLVKAAGDAQALNAQFATVFGEIETTAKDSLTRIGEATGIIPDRLQASFTQMAAFAKTTGMETADALALTERATMAAADSAAFYDRSIEEVTENLQSFLKGNYENDAALGISATETTRNAKANELYGESFNKLSEAQKQLTLLAMVEDGNKLSGALGQAARESDGLENVLGNLKQAWENLKVKLGEPILDTAIAGIKMLTDILQNINVEPLISAFESIKSVIAGVVDTIKNAFSGANFSTIVSVVSGYFDVIRTEITVVKDFWAAEGQSTIDRLAQIFSSLKSIIGPIVESAVSLANETFAKIKSFWESDGQQLLSAAQNLFNGILAVVNFCMPAVKFVVDYVWSAVKNVITGALDVIMGAVKIFSGLFTGDWSKLWDGVKQLFVGAVNLILGIMSLSFVGGIRTALTNLAKTAINIVKGKWTSIVNLFKSSTSASWSTIKTWATNLVSSIKTMAANAVSQVKNMGTNLVNAIKSVPSKFLQIGKDIMQGLINGIKSLNPVSAITGVIGSVITSAKSMLGIASPSKLFTQFGKWISQGLAIGIEDDAEKVEQAVNELVSATIKTAESQVKDIQGIVSKSNQANSAEIIKVQKELATEREKITQDAATKIAAIERKASNAKRALNEEERIKIAAINTKAEEDRVKASQKSNEAIAKLESAAATARLQALKADVEARKQAGQMNAQAEVDYWKYARLAFEKGTKEHTEVLKQYNVALAALDKEKLANIESFIADKKSLNQLSLADEVAIWQANLETFKKGTDEQLKVQKNYKTAVDAVKKELTSINDNYKSRMQKISDELIKAEQDLTNNLNNEMDKRRDALYNFAGMFDEVTIKSDITGKKLLENLASQVVAMEDWASNLQQLAAKGIDEGLLSELQAMGPKALSEIAALNTLTEAELTAYEQLWQEKSELARTQTEAEFAGMKEDTAAQVEALRAAATDEIAALTSEWQSEIEAITSATESELSTLESIGVNAATGLLNGMSSMAPALQAKAHEIASSIATTMEQALQVKSPSRVTTQIGAYAGEGLEVGLEKKVTAVRKAAKKVVKATTQELQTAVAETAAIGAEIGNSLAQDIKDKVRENMYKPSSTTTSSSDSSGSSSSKAESENEKLAEKIDYSIKLLDRRNKMLNEILANEEYTHEERLKALEDFLSRQKELQLLSLEDELDIWQVSIGAFAENSEERRLAELAYYDAQQRAIAERLNTEKAYMDERKRLNQLTLTDELALYEQFIQNYAKGTSEYLYYLELIQDTKAQVYDKLHSLNIKYTELIRKENEKVATETQKAEKKLASETLKINEATHQQLVKSEQDYNETILDIKQKAADAEKAIIANRKKELVDYAGLFDKVSKKEGITGKRLMIALKSQNDTMKKWQSNLNSLSAKGMDTALLSELQAMGPAAATEIASLNSLSEAELDEYAAMWREKSALAASQVDNELRDMNSQTSQQIAELRADTANQLAIQAAQFQATNAAIRLDQQTQLETLRADTEQQLATMRQETATQLDLYAQEWQSAVSEVKDGTKDEFNALVEDMPTIGANVIEGMMQGLADMAPALVQQANAIAESIKSTIQSALDIHSPSRWARNFIMGNLARGFELGAEDNKSTFVGAADKMAAWLKPDLKLNTNIGANGLYVGRLTPATATTTNSTTSHTDQSQHVNATFNINGSGNSARDVKRAWRELTFRMGV